LCHRKPPWPRSSRLLRRRARAPCWTEGEESPYAIQTCSVISSLCDDSAVAPAAARFEHALGVRQPPSRDFPSKSARDEVTTLDVNGDDVGLVRLHCPQLGAAGCIPEPEKTFGIASDHHAV